MGGGWITEAYHAAQADLKATERQIKEERGEISSEDAVIVVTDIHHGKETPSFNPEVSAERLTKVGEKIDQIRELLAPSHSLRKLWVLMAGDLVDGAGVYKTQVHHQAITDAEEQAAELSDIFAEWSKRRLGHWENVEYQIAYGNHGRSSFYAKESQNFDLSFARLLEAKCRVWPQVKVDWGNTDGIRQVRKVTIRGHQIILTHGNQLKAYRRIPWYGMEQMVKDWAVSSLAPFESVVAGHWHTAGIWPVGDKEMVLNGTLVTDDLWALEELGRESTTKWWFYGISNERRRTWEYQLDLCK